MQGVKTKWQTLITRVKDCIPSGNHHLLDLGIDGGKWLKAKENREHGSNLTDRKSLVPDPPQKNWRVFPSYDIPSLFNYGHVYHYAYAYAGRVAVHEPSLSVEKCQETAKKSVVFLGCVVSHVF